PVMSRSPRLPNQRSSGGWETPKRAFFSSLLARFLLRARLLRARRRRRLRPRLIGRERRAGVEGLHERLRRHRAVALVDPLLEQPDRDVLALRELRRDPARLAEAVARL